LVTPFFDGWSVDAWIVDEHRVFVPSRLANVSQKLDMKRGFAVLSTAQSDDFVLDSRTEVQTDGEGSPVCTITFNAQAVNKAWLMICVRPYNPEGMSFIKDVESLADGKGWKVNKKEILQLDKKPQRYVFANYASGDLWEKNRRGAAGDVARSISCLTGMATSAALYVLEPGRREEVTVKVPLSQEGPFKGWPEQMQKLCVLKVPDKKCEFLFNAAIKTIILHSPGDIYPGPFTYKRFWFRDAAFILRAMMAVGLSGNIEKIIDRFAGRQTPTGYFMSQEGEWDSNGQAIWAMKRYIDTEQVDIKHGWLTSIYRAAGWIKRKRHFSDSDPLHSGLLPAGFSAEHFGPSDFYYWDDFWAVAGLRDASLLAQMRDTRLSKDFEQEADNLLTAIEHSIASVQDRLHHPGIPASPSRRMDAGAVGCLAASYPLQIYPEKDERILQTAKFLMDKHFLQGTFYHEISHSGINIYLSLHIAQVLMRAGNPKFFHIVQSVAELATPTGQWPEAIHPGTRGGCMGDGQHVWASAEWVMMMRNMFVREEEAKGMLILCSGIPPEWLKLNETLFLGPTQTLYGEISVTVKVMEEYIHIRWQARWHHDPPPIEIRLHGHESCFINDNSTSVKVNRKEALV
jgi:hypothetical protein